MRKVVAKIDLAWFFPVCTFVLLTIAAPPIVTAAEDDPAKSEARDMVKKVEHLEKPGCAPTKEEEEIAESHVFHLAENLARSPALQHEIEMNGGFDRDFMQTARIVLEKDSPVAVTKALLKLNACHDSTMGRQLGYILQYATSPDVPTLIEALNDDDDVKRECIARVLGHSSDKAIPLLQKALKDFKGQKRFDAACVLAHFGTKGADAVPELTKHLTTTDPKELVRAIDAITDLGPAASSAVPELMKLMDHGTPAVQNAAIRALEEMGPAASNSIPKLIEFLSDVHVTYNASMALGKIADVSSIPLIIDKLKNSGITEREDLSSGGISAIRVLVEMSHQGDAKRQAVVSALLKSLKDGDAQLRARAAHALGQMTDVLNARADGMNQTVITELVKIAKDPNEKLLLVLREVFFALGEMGEKALPDLIVFAGDQKFSALAIPQIEKMGPKAAPAAQALVKLIREGDIEKDAAIQALIAIGPQARLDLSDYVEFLSNPDGHIRSYAAAAIGNIGLPALPEVSKLLLDQPDKQKKNDKKSETNDELRNRLEGALSAVAHMPPDPNAFTDLALKLLEMDDELHKTVGANIVAKKNITAPKVVPLLIRLYEMKGPDRKRIFPFFGTLRYADPNIASNIDDFDMLFNHIIQFRDELKVQLETAKDSPMLPTVSKEFVHEFFLYGDTFIRWFPDEAPHVIEYMKKAIARDEARGGNQLRYQLYEQILKHPSWQREEFLKLVVEPLNSPTTDRNGIEIATQSAAVRNRILVHLQDEMGLLKPYDIEKELEHGFSREFYLSLTAKLPQKLTEADIKWMADQLPEPALEKSKNESNENKPSFLHGRKNLNQELGLASHKESAHTADVLKLLSTLDPKSPYYDSLVKKVDAKVRGLVIKYSEATTHFQKTTAYSLLQLAHLPAWENLFSEVVDGKTRAQWIETTELNLND